MGEGILLGTDANYSAVGEAVASRSTHGLEVGCEMLWDRDGWRASVEREFQRLDDGSVAIRVRTANEQAYSNDTYVAASETFTLRSPDGGKSWQRYAGPLREETETRLAGSTRLKVYSGGQLSLEERQGLLTRVGVNRQRLGARETLCGQMRSGRS